MPLKFRLFTSSILSFPRDDNRCLNGSGFGDEIDWIIRSIFSVLAQSVKYFLPSLLSNFSCTQIGDNCKSINSLCFTFHRYCLGVGLSVSTVTTSTMEKYRSSLYIIFLTGKLSNKEILVEIILSRQILSFSYSQSLIFWTLLQEKYLYYHDWGLEKSFFN